MPTQMLITGGAGFIGTHLALHYAQRGEQVTVFDNLSRAGSEHNLRWLEEQGARVRFVRGDVRDFEALREATRGSQVILHLAAQVAVTTSVLSPREDFEINALGTLNVLEAARASGSAPMVLYSSTNKVYGGMDDLQVTERDGRYEFADLRWGVDERRPLDFHSPYGCSKGSGDQYVRDYARIYGLPTVVFRQSCIYGERQFGIEDQGWLAHFVISILLGRQITIYGDGKQIRDVLYIGDLIRAFDLAISRIDKVRGEIFNIGGGPANTLAVWSQAGPILERLAGRPIKVEFGDWRPGDQKVYVSDVRKAKRMLGWEPTTGPEAGLAKLWEWAAANKGLFSQ